MDVADQTQIILCMSCATKPRLQKRVRSIFIGNFYRLVLIYVTVFRQDFLLPAHPGGPGVPVHRTRWCPHADVAEPVQQGYQAHVDCFLESSTVPVKVR